MGSKSGRSIRYSESHWRNTAQPIIARVIAEHKDKPAELRKALRDAYPFGQRKYHPYTIWCDEVARQLGRKPKLGTVGRRTLERRAVADERQAKLFTPQSGKAIII